MESYEQMLDEGYKEIKPAAISKSFERFEIPKANAQIQGNKTVVNNFLQIASYLRRDPLHLMKFLSKFQPVFLLIKRFSYSLIKAPASLIRVQEINSFNLLSTVHWMSPSNPRKMSFYTPLFQKQKLFLKMESREKMDGI